MRVLAVINGLGTGGAERSLAESIMPLRERGVDIEVATLHRRPAAGVQEAVAALTTVHALEGSTARQLRQLRRVIGTGGFDLVHTTIFEADLVGRLASTRRVPVLTSLVNTSYEPIRLEDPRVRRSRFEAARLLDAVTGRAFTTRFHAITHVVADSARRRLRIPAERITVIPRARDKTRLGEQSEERRDRVRASLGVRPDEQLILSVGRQEYQKGQLDLVRAVAGLTRQRPEVRLMVAGRSGNASAEIDDAVRRHDLEDRCTFLGHREDVPDLLVAADALAFPSLYEGLGGTLIEAMALGTPIVTSDLPVTREVLGDAAVFTPVGDAAAIQQALAELLDDPPLCLRLAQAGKRRFENTFDLDMVSDRMAELMHATAAHGRH